MPQCQIVYDKFHKKTELIQNGRSKAPRMEAVVAAINKKNCRDGTGSDVLHDVEAGIFE